MLYKLNSILLKGAAKFASNIAIEDFKGNSVNYKDLYIKVSIVKDFLSKLGVNAGIRIGIIGPKSINYVTYIFGIMECQAAYVPIDANAPLSRNISIINDCELKAIFVESNSVKTYTSAFSNNMRYEVIDFNNEYSFILFKNNTQLHQQNLAYILYTSGSTGTPKGVMHTHQSAWAFINWSIKKFKPNFKDKFSSQAPFHFDLSIFDIFVPLSVGATLVLFDDQTTHNPLLLSAELSKKQISYLYATPTALTYLNSYGKLYKHSFSHLKNIMFAGEVFPINDLRSIKTNLPHVTFYNLYGPTETNVCTYFKIPSKIAKKQLNPFPIGKACSFAKVKIKEVNKKKGELLVSGSSIMIGYWNDKVKTKSAIVIDSDCNTWYHTGDIVSLNSIGNYEYIGRKDRMVKRRGYRIELSEIETALNGHKDVLQVAVLSNSINNQSNITIVAHVVLKSRSQLTELELYKYCQQVLIDYMLPDLFKFHKKLPITSTHKIDYKTLSSLYE